MNASLIVMLGLPVLYVTGSLRKAVAGAKVSGLCFVLYFVCATLLSLVPAIRVAQNVTVDIDGVFVCFAPAVYLLVKGRYNYKLHITAALMALIAVAATFFFGAYTVPYLPYSIGLVISMIAALVFRAEAPVFAPVLIGLYSAAENTMIMLTGTGTARWFHDVEMVALSVVVCIFVAVLAARPKGRHSRGGRRDMATQ